MAAGASGNRVTTPPQRIRNSRTSHAHSRRMSLPKRDSSEARREVGIEGTRGKSSSAGGMGGVAGLRVGEALEGGGTGLAVDGDGDGGLGSKPQAIEAWNNGGE